MRIPSESWSKIQTTIRQYPKNCQRLTDWQMEILDANLKEKDPTGHKALLLSSEYAQRLMREIEAVEDMLDHLSEDEQAVIRLRFWSGRSVVPYEYMGRAHYSIRQMQRIVSKAVQIVGVNIGELNPKRWRI